ncbi:hypothetical protein [Xanthobacter sediminis]
MVSLPGRAAERVPVRDEALLTLAEDAIRETQSARAAADRVPHDHDDGDGEPPHFIGAWGE